jgi:hypothetical protein
VEYFSMFKTTALAASTAATAFGTPAYPGVPSAAGGDVTCSDSPTSKAPYEAGREYGAKALAGQAALLADPNSVAAIGKLHEERNAAERQRETNLHAVSAIGEFLAWIKGDWTPENVTEAAGILRDLGLDVWQVRSFVGDGKGDKGGNSYRTIVLAQVTQALTGET